MSVVLVIAIWLLGLCNASPRFIRGALLPGAAVVESSAQPTSWPGSNSTASNATSLDTASVTGGASVTPTPPPPTSTGGKKRKTRDVVLTSGASAPIHSCYDKNYCNGATSSSIKLPPERCACGFLVLAGKPGRALSALDHAIAKTRASERLGFLVWGISFPTGATGRVVGSLRVVEASETAGEDQVADGIIKAFVGGHGMGWFVLDMDMDSRLLRPTQATIRMEGHQKGPVFWNNHVWAYYHPSYCNTAPAKSLPVLTRPPDLHKTHSTVLPRRHGEIRTASPGHVEQGRMPGGMTGTTEDGSAVGAKRKETSVDPSLGSSALQVCQMRGPLLPIEPLSLGLLQADPGRGFARCGGNPRQLVEQQSPALSSTMVHVHCAYTEQINPAGSDPVLSRDQVGFSLSLTTLLSRPQELAAVGRNVSPIWKGLQRKIRHAEDFVPIIEKTDVIEDDKPNEVVRVAHFVEAFGQPAHTVREVCKSYYPTKVDFWQPNGALITNTVSDGPGLTEKDYNMTYTFEWIYENVAEGSEEHKKLELQHREGAQTAVHKSIEALRRMAAAGELD
ncbi:hypothetical protein Q7P37_003888 [Cladosporium fusiforme]